MAGKAINELGNRYTRLKVIERAGTEGTTATWHCVCDCGTHIVAIGTKLRNKHTQSCGCLRVDSATKHGLAGTAIYCIWSAMKQRCGNSKHIAFARYGGRGITVCARWADFELFLQDIGDRPSQDHTLERRDNSLGYSPENVYWATPKQQGRNRVDNRMLTHDGKTQCMAAWAEELGMSRHALYQRLKHDWSIERALTQPVRGL